MTVWVANSPHVPAVLLLNDADSCRTSVDHSLEHCIGIVDHQYHSGRRTIQAFWAKIGVFWGFVMNPKFGAFLG